MHANIAGGAGFLALFFNPCGVQSEGWALLNLHYGPLCLASTLLHIWCNFVGYLSWPLPLEGKLDHMMLELLLVFLPCRDSLQQSLCTFPLVDLLMCECG